MSSPLSAFTAIPNPQMPAFLGAQSFIMMYQAGEGWQYGKRRISALSNEAFNKITPQSLMERQAMELKGAIPIIERSMNNMTRMVPMIIEQYGDFIREAIKAMPAALAAIFQPSNTSFMGTQNLSSLTNVRLSGNRQDQEQLRKDLEKFAADILAQASRIGGQSGASIAAEKARLAAERSAATAQSIAEANRLRIARQRDIALNITQDPTPQLSQQGQVNLAAGRLRLAGQSQIKERLILIRAIAEHGRNITNGQRQGWAATYIQQQRNLMKAAQQKLVNLLSRYRFQ